MNRIICGLLSVLIVGGAVVTLGSKSAPQLPAGVSEAQWTKISETAGIAISERHAGQVVGSLYIKSGDRWTEVSIENAPRGVLTH